MNKKSLHKTTFTTLSILTNTQFWIQRTRKVLYKNVMSKIHSNPPINLTIWRGFWIILEVNYLKVKHDVGVWEKNIKIMFMYNISLLKIVLLHITFIREMLLKQLILEIHLCNHYFIIVRPFQFLFIKKAIIIWNIPKICIMFHGYLMVFYKNYFICSNIL